MNWVYTGGYWWIHWWVLGKMSHTGDSWDKTWDVPTWKGESYWKQRDTVRSKMNEKVNFLYLKVQWNESVMHVSSLFCIGGIILTFTGPGISQSLKRLLVHSLSNPSDRPDVRSPSAFSKAYCWLDCRSFVDLVDPTTAKRSFLQASPGSWSQNDDWGWNFGQR